MKLMACDKATSPQQATNDIGSCETPDSAIVIHVTAFSVCRGTLSFGTFIENN